MTQDSGFHMKPRNLRNLLSCGHQNPSYKQLLYIYTRSTQQVGGKKETNLLLLELVWAKDFEALLRLLGGETLAAASQILEHFLEGDVLLQRREKKSNTIAYDAANSSERILPTTVATTWNEYGPNAYSLGCTSS
jgi:hypothetical protein